MEFLTARISNKTAAMNQEEILRASLLDIVFDQRNKSYGAYVLRKNYSKRLALSLVMAFSFVALLFYLISLMQGENIQPAIPSQHQITEVVESAGAPLPPPPPAVQPPASAAVQAATIQDVSTIVITPDRITSRVPSVDDLLDHLPATITQTGASPLDPRARPSTGEGEGANPVTNTPAPVQNNFVAEEMNPSFPGGEEALRKFLSANLVTPDELETGEKKMVRIKFKVEQDGKVSGLEIIGSGGEIFDQEVLRVCRKMPKWIPARQNGIYVPVNYVLPVTFVGVEQ